VLGASTDGSTGRLVLAVVLAVVVGAVVGVLTEVLVVRPLDGRELEQLLATVGLGIAVTAYLQGIAGPDEKALPVPSWLTSTVDVLGANVPVARFVVIGAAVVVFGLLQLFLARTRHGIAIRASVENQEMVRALGVSTRPSYLLVFAISGATAGLAGSMAAVTFASVSPTMGDHLLIFAITVLVVGGLGSLPGAIIAAVLIGLLQQYANYYAAGAVGDVLAVVAMAVVLLLRPQGLLGQRRRLT
jgi:branched-chain amino acid transport system permease protein